VPATTAVVELVPPIGEVVPPITICVPPGARETMVPDMVMGEPPGVSVVPSMTTKPEGLRETVVSPTMTTVGVGETRTEVEIGVLKSGGLELLPSGGPKGEVAGGLLEGCVVEGMVVGPVEPGDALEVVDVVVVVPWVSAAAVIGVKKPGSCCKDFGGS
jgi:hypothetical protein